jgi:hypothetical protein
VNRILELLLAHTGRLETPSSVPADALTSLRRIFAASLIQQIPGALPIVPDAAVDPAINEAATAGAALAAERAQSGTHLRVVRDSYATPAPTPDRPTQVFGPFVEADGSLVRFAVFESSHFLTVHLSEPAPSLGEVLMLLPAETITIPGIDSSTSVIPAGTVWIHARLLVRNALGYVGLRVKEGSLLITPPASTMPGGGFSVQKFAQWTLELEPEQPTPATDADGSDADALTVQLPTRLEVRSRGASTANATANGALAMTSFGADLEFANPVGGPIVEGGTVDAASIAFPYDADDAVWSIDGNRSAAAQFAGTGSVVSAAWSLPIRDAPPNTFGEAEHGGSLTFRLSDGLESRMLGAGGAFRWFNTVLTANGQGVLLDALGRSSARIELELWTHARTDAILAGQDLNLLFSSKRGSPDVAVVRGGQIRNRWDLPLTAAGQPFPYEGALDLFAVFAEVTGLLRIVCLAMQQPEPRSHGIALENLYLLVRPPRKLGFSGDYDGASRVSNGTALLFFDVMLAQPSLPDPYAASWPLPDETFIAEAALSNTLRWAETQTPTVEARLERAVQFPEPREVPEDEDSTLRALFDRHLGSQFEFLNLLDLSSHDHHFGVALETPSDQQPRITENRLTVELRDVRLLMQPQVQWEPVQVEPNPEAGVTHREVVSSTTNGARTLAGADSVKLVPVAPGVVGREIVAAAKQNQSVCALFSLPFGLRAFARIDAIHEQPLAIPAILTEMHEPRFDDLASAQQLRLTATGGRHPGTEPDPARSMPGSMRQLPNLIVPNKNNLQSVLQGIDLGEFQRFVPLHRADLSGYGLSTFSDWHRDAEFGVFQVRFDVVNGRTSYEVIQTRSVLACSQSRVVRTIILERRNSGRVLRFDSGWIPIDDGEFTRYVPFEKGVVKAFRNIRHIRILDKAPLTLSDGSVWQPVLYDADAELENVVAGGSGSLVPIRDHAGYVQLTPAGPSAAPNAARFRALFERVGTSIGGPIDCTIRVNDTLEMYLSGIFADAAPDDVGTDPGFVIAAYGLPKLPRAGQWSAVRINGATLEASPVDPRHGIPVIRRPGQPYTFRDPADAHRTNPNAEYGFLMATQTSRVLFPRPTLDPNQIDRLTTAKPVVADPYSLVQASSAFPRPTFALRCNEVPVFNISRANAWKLTNPDFSFSKPEPNLVKGGEWAIERDFTSTPPLQLLVDSAVPEVGSAVPGGPWGITVPPNDLKIDIEPFGPLFTIQTNYDALSGEVPKLAQPNLKFEGKLKDLKEVLDSLKRLIDLPFNFDVNVVAGSGPSPSFVVIINLKFLIGEGPNERIDIGVGKFYGQFLVDGQLDAALTGTIRGGLLAEFQGDVQMGIIPPLIYAGGLFRFAIQIRETGSPLLELGLGAAVSIGGDLVKGLLEVEITIRYGYTLIPETLAPGVLLGLEARAKLLAGLIGFSFAVLAMARIQSRQDNSLSLYADIRVAATVQLAFFIEEEVDFRTQFEQTIPLSRVVAAEFNQALDSATAQL